MLAETPGNDFPRSEQAPQETTGALAGDLGQPHISDGVPAQGTLRVEVIRGGEVELERVSRCEPPAVEVVGTSGIADFSRLSPRCADACIYCGSTLALSREHVICRALGGKTTIPRGSCKECQRITSRFETVVVRGPLRMVRWVQGMPSESRHKNVPDTVTVTITTNGMPRSIRVPRSDAPILLPFPVFRPPQYVGRRVSGLEMIGAALCSFGADPAEFAKKYGAEELEMRMGATDALAFAQLLAKTAYANAYVCGQLERLEDPGDLVRAMMKEPNALGRFVGTEPEPYRKYPGVLHRLSIHELPEHRLLVSQVQLFSNAGAPSYIVVLGGLRDDDHGSVGSEGSDQAGR